MYIEYNDILSKICTLGTEDMLAQEAHAMNAWSWQVGGRVESLKSLDLQETALSDAGLEAELRALERAPVQRIKFYKTAVTDAGLAALATWLREASPAQQRALREVHFSHCAITDDGVQVLLAAVRELPRERPLWVQCRWNYLSAAFVRNLANAGTVCIAESLACKPDGACEWVDQGYAAPVVHLRGARDQRGGTLPTPRAALRPPNGAPVEEGKHAEEGKCDIWPPPPRMSWMQTRGEMSEQESRCWTNAAEGEWVVEVEAPAEAQERQRAAEDEWVVEVEARAEARERQRSREMFGARSGEKQWYWREGEEDRRSRSPWVRSNVVTFSDVAGIGDEEIHAYCAPWNASGRDVRIFHFYDKSTQHVVVEFGSIEHAKGMLQDVLRHPGHYALRGKRVNVHYATHATRKALGKRVKVD